MTADERKDDELREEDPREGRRRTWSYFDYLDKVEEEMAKGRFASQSK